MFKKISPKILPLTKYEKYLSADRVSPDEGVIEYLMSVIKPENKYCIEFGARDGLRAHVAFLINKYDYSALLLEGDPEAAEQLNKNYSHNEKVKTAHSFITRGNIEETFKQNGVPQSPAFLLIDMDGNDYHIWKAIKNYTPLAVSIEYNPSFKPPEKFIIDYQEDFMWSGDDYYGASISSMVELAKEKGYELVHCSSGGDNLFFVKKELFGLFDIEDNSVEAIYQLPQYGKKGRAINGKGHPISVKNSNLRERLLAALRYRLYAIPRRFIKKKMKKDVRNRSKL